METTLDLHRHCIQTAIKQKYNRLIADYFKSPTENQAIRESEISLLKTALETLDFGKLRADFPVLRGGGAGDIRLGSDNGKTLTLSINGAIIYATHTNHPTL